MVNINDILERNSFYETPHHVQRIKLILNYFSNFLSEIEKLNICPDRRKLRNLDNLITISLKSNIYYVYCALLNTLTLNHFYTFKKF